MTLRTRLLVAMAAVVVLLVAVGLAILGSTERHLVTQVDRQLLRASVETGPFGPGGPIARRRPEGWSDLPGQVFVAWLDPSGDDLAVWTRPTTTADSAADPNLAASDIREAPTRTAFTVHAGEGDLRYRVVVADGTGRWAGGRWVYALPLEDVDATVDRLRLVELTALAVTVGALGLVTFWVLRLGVRPLKEMTATAVAIGEGDRSRRIPESAPGTEAAALGNALNHMLERINDAFDERAQGEARLRRFVADASHELRTPVTTIRGYAELYRRGGLEEGVALDDAMSRTEAEAVRMGDLVEDLLRLARLDEGRPLRLAPLALDAVIADAARDAAAVDGERTVEVEPGPTVVAVVDESLVRQVVANLLANVRVHTPPGTRVRLSATTDGGEAVVTVTDDGPGMTADHAARAFERFYRADASRHRHSGGSGLGLSIVAGVLAAHGGRAELVSEPGGGTTVRLRFPTTGPLPTADPAPD